MYIDNRSVIVFLEMRSQTLLAQKPKRVGRLANVGTEVRKKTAKLFSNFLSFKHHFPKIDTLTSTQLYITVMYDKKRNNVKCLEISREYRNFA